MTTIASYQQRVGNHWEVTFGDFHMDEVPYLVDGVVQDYVENNMFQLDILNWNETVEALVTAMIHRGFILSTQRGDKGEVIQRYVWKRNGY